MPEVNSRYNNGVKKLTNYISRPKSVLTEKANLEPLYTLKDFPVFMGCVDAPPEEDIVADMDWAICPETGIIQLLKLIPLEILYLTQHNDGTGQVWQNHYLEFAKFIKQFNSGKYILEIGGAHDWIFKRYQELDPNVRWTIVEPNPQHIENPEIKVIKAWFDDKFTLKEPVDTIIHSHVFEHTFDPAQFIEHIGKFLKPGQKHLFAFPNFLPMLKNKQTNCLNFEHTVFLTDHFTEYLLNKNGFEILGKQYYGDPHSIFYATEKAKDPLSTAHLTNKYEEYKSIFMDFVNYHLEIIKDLNDKIQYSPLPTYLFGAHIFSQFLIQFGLQTDKILAILDNSPIKQKKRLYGTRFIVESPKILKDQGPVNIILKAGAYDDEIKKDILENINPETKFW